MYVCADRPVCMNILKPEFWSHHDYNPAFTISVIILFDDPWFLQWLLTRNNLSDFEYMYLQIGGGEYENMQMAR